jgi:hypothetical protein
MAKQTIPLIFLALLFSCSQSKNQDAPGDKFLGNWHMEAIKNPKYPYYVYDYSIAKNGEGFTVKVHTTCPKCKDSTLEERNYIFAGEYNGEKNVFEIEKEGYKETLSIQEPLPYMVSNKFPKYIFTKIK